MKRDKIARFGSLTTMEHHDRSIADEIRILAEVEKIWIRHDLNEMQGDLQFSEIKEYLRETACPNMNLNILEMKALFDMIDLNNDKVVTKDEMVIFLTDLVSS